MLEQLSEFVFITTAKDGDVYTQHKHNGSWHIFDETYIQAVKGAKFDFKQQAELQEGVKLMPVIFSHGNWGNSALYTGHCQELASHGYIVFAIDHNDHSNLYTEKKGGVPVVLTPTFNNKYIDKMSEANKMKTLDIRSD